MILSSTEAREFMVCPLALIAGSRRLCLGPECMAWTWREDDYRVVYVGINDPAPENGVRDNFIKRADIDPDLPTGKLAYRVANVERRGTCGMIQAAQIWNEEHPPRNKRLG